jgi:hypothetical protein
MRSQRFQKIEGYIQPLHIKEINKAWYLIGHNEILGIYAFCLDDRIEEYKKYSSSEMDSLINVFKIKHGKDEYNILKIKLSDNFEEKMN